MKEGKRMTGGGCRESRKKMENSRVVKRKRKGMKGKRIKRNGEL